MRFRSLRRVQESHPTRQFCRIDKDTMHSSFIREKVGWSLSSHYTSNSSVFSSRFHLVHCNRHREVGVAGSPMIAAFDASCSTFKCHCPQPDRNTNCNVDIKTRQQFAGCGLCCTLLHTHTHTYTHTHTHGSEHHTKLGALLSNMTLRFGQRGEFVAVSSSWDMLWALILSWAFRIHGRF